MLYIYNRALIIYGHSYQPLDFNLMIMHYTINNITVFINNSILKNSPIFTRLIKTKKR